MTAEPILAFIRERYDKHELKSRTDFHHVAIMDELDIIEDYIENLQRLESLANPNPEIVFKGVKPQ